ncbi:very short patch repair endonuclease [Bradyrhizobium sp. WSM3983]|uniref:very short patch repair endonuclease n=1 Tax=Bradyrhizobium sp. WSM3983 TaxID=1038867 RepID=UPI000404E1F3|nr:very short patch repair endonuclease [Bradyrhizobium sp. WSM3983]
MDIFTPARRSEIMSRIRSVDTSPEVRLRTQLYRLGLRYRNNVRELPGKPDIVFRKYKYAVQVRGCFWHAHKDCGRSNRPATNKSYWLPKLARNVARDKKNDAALRALGWKVKVVWECDIASASSLEKVARKISDEVISRASKQ